MAAVRRGHEPLNVDVAAPQSDLPPIAAVFLVLFDIKAGYTVSWKRSLPGLEVEGVVEYKSLPSGLHTVNEDLVYFVHDNHAGLSAFVNAPAGEERRNANMLAVGIMVPLSFGRLGRSWKHAHVLKDMANQMILDPTNTKLLEAFWEEHKPANTLASSESASILDSPSSIQFQPAQKPLESGRNRSASDGTALLSSHNLAPYHPAWSLPHLLETFGPLIFPIHRAALLRKRILLTSHAPVHETCNFVYDISVLSNIPLAVDELIASDAPSQRLRPLFCIGVHDIPSLEEDLRAQQAAVTTPVPEPRRDENGSGWIACTTDSILAMKSTLYDVLITMPPLHCAEASSKIWPKVESPQGIELRATQRDLRRYQALQWGLSRHFCPPSSRRPSTSSQASTDRTLLAASASTLPSRENAMRDTQDTDTIVEPLSWSALAYSGFMWWASAGEQRVHSEEEADFDDSLLSNLAFPRGTPKTPPVLSPWPHSTPPVEQTPSKTAVRELAIIAYFHRLTANMLSILSDLVDTTGSDDDREDQQPLVDGEGNEEHDGPRIYVSSADVARMGLDVWSPNDHKFIEEATNLYFGQRVHIEGRSIDVCGVRVC